MFKEDAFVVNLAPNNNNNIIILTMYVYYSHIYIYTKLYNLKDISIFAFFVLIIQRTIKFIRTFKPKIKLLKYKFYD